MAKKPEKLVTKVDYRREEITLEFTYENSVIDYPLIGKFSRKEAKALAKQLGVPLQQMPAELSKENG